MIEDLRAALAQSSKNLCAALSVTEHDVSPSQEEIAAVEEQCQQVAEALLQLSQQPRIVIPSQEIEKHLGATQESVIKELSITTELLLKVSKKLYEEGDSVEAEHLLQAVERRSPSVSPVRSAPATPAHHSPRLRDPLLLIVLRLQCTPLFCKGHSHPSSTPPLHQFISFIHLCCKGRSHQSSTPLQHQFVSFIHLCCKGLILLSLNPRSSKARDSYVQEKLLLRPKRRSWW